MSAGDLTVRAPQFGKGEFGGFIVGRRPRERVSFQGKG